MTTPLACNWKPGALYTIYFQGSDNIIFSQESANAPSGSNGAFCIDYQCTQLQSIGRLVTFVGIGLATGLAAGYIATRRRFKLAVTLLIVLLLLLALLPQFEAYTNDSLVRITAVNTKIISGPNVQYGTGLVGSPFSISASPNATAASPGSVITLTLTVSNQDPEIAHEISFITFNSSEFSFVSTNPGLQLSFRPTFGGQIIVTAETLCGSRSSWWGTCNGPVYSGPLNLTVFVYI
jgi:uncharacterized membrane protein (Fun14 family)